MTTTLLLTGAGRGLGLALAQGALERGWIVYGSVRSKPDADRLAGLLGPGFQPFEMDVGNAKSIASAIASLPGKFDVVINNAGIIGKSDGPETTVSEDYEALFRVNSIGPVLVAQAALPKLRRSARPVILSVSTQMSFMGSSASDHSAYRASKVALNKMMQGLASELAGEKITVLTVDPGWVRTDMGGSSAPLAPADVAAGILDLASRATPEMSGKFWLWSGQQRAY